MSPITPSQTVGPYFSIGLMPQERQGAPLIGNALVTPDAAGEHIRVEGRVLDGDGCPVDDALLEIWQADAAGHYADEDEAQRRSNAGLRGFGRAGTDANGAFWFATIKPGRVPGPNGTLQAPHIVMAIFARGMLRHRYTRIYFAGERANVGDPVLALVPPARQATLLAKPERQGADVVYRFDVRLQGEDETVFFDV
jgi:protocatechuate 3,4-dioxygenase alpha subunit